jgi:hypothetical protein
MAGRRHPVHGGVPVRARIADEGGMRRRSLAATLVVTAAGLVASAALRRVAARRRTLIVRQPAVTPVVPPVREAVAEPVAQSVAEVPADQDAVVLPFGRRGGLEAATERPAAAVRCGDSGGRTRTGAPCAARATSGGRCHHHPLAA